MKKQRLLAAALTVSMTVGMGAVPATAASFKDLKGHWAKTDVEYLADQGLVSGYSDGSFKPDAAMSAVEALLFCARVARIDAAVKAKIANAWSDTLADIIPYDMRSWAGPDLSVCLEIGVVSVSELQSLANNNGLLGAIPREKVALYLARAMQLSDAADSLDGYSLSFRDKDEIDRSLRPYVYLLSQYGIVKGDEQDRFLPKSSVNRASMTSLMRRAMDFMTLHGITMDLADYTDYEWTGGTITSVSANTSGSARIGLTDPVNGARTLTVPSYAVIYQNNMRADQSALKTGVYAKVELNKSGTPTAVRLGRQPSTVTGTISSLSKTAVVLKVDGSAKTYKADRFTAVKAGDKTGGTELLDKSRDYTGAVCLVDRDDHLAAVQLTGGTKTTVGLIADVKASGSSSMKLQVLAMDGTKTSYTIPGSAAVSVNGSKGKLSSTQVGDYVVLTVSNEDESKITGVEVDTKTTYVRGSVRSTSKSRDEITIQDFDKRKNVTYKVPSGIDITYEGEKISLSKLDRDDYVTMQVSKTEAVSIMAYPGSTSDEGTIRSITYGTTTVLEIVRDDGTVVSYDIDMDDLPTIYRGDEKSTIDRLKSGDEVEITIRYNEVSAIDATPQSANAKGTIQKVSLDTSGTTLDVQLSDGSTVSYRVSSSVSVTQDGKSVSIDTLKPGFKVSLVLEGDQILSIEVDKSAAMANQVQGEVLYVNRSAGELLIQKSSDSSVVTVNVASASILTSGGKTLALKELSSGDYITLYGAYDGLTFKATLIIRP